MRDPVKGILAIVSACVIWGLSPLYYKMLAHVPPLEVLSHRTLWSFVIFFLVLSVQGRLLILLSALTLRSSLIVIALAGVLISTNWFVFILSVQIGRSVEASLGYYIFPLASVAFGYFVFGERLVLVQWLAIFLALCAVIVLTTGLGVPPWISLILATTFGIYGLIKKKLEVGPVVSVTGEVLLLLPLALIWLWGVGFQGWTGFVGREGGYFGSNLQDTLMLMLSGLITAGPLILFSYATKRLRLSTVGLVQYINPTLQFLVATLIFREAFTMWHAAAFLLIWSGLLIYSVSSIRQDRLARSES